MCAFHMNEPDFLCSVRHHSLSKARTRSYRKHVRRRSKSADRPATEAGTSSEEAPSDHDDKVRACGCEWARACVWVGVCSSE